MFVGNVDVLNQRFFIEANSSPRFKPLVSRLTNEKWAKYFMFSITQ